MPASVIHGDCIATMRTMDENSIDSVCTDPPYELSFMGKKWDGTGIAFDKDTWAEAYRVLKPGGHLVAFGGSRTYHRIAVAIEDAGFEIRDSLMYLYGTGFPKSHNVNKALGNAVCGCSASNDKLRGMRISEDNASVLVQADQDPGMLTQMQRGVARSGMGEAWSQGQRSADAGGNSGGTCEDDRAEQSSVEGRHDIQTIEGQLSGRSLGALSGRHDSNDDVEWLCDGTPSSNGEMDRASIDAHGMRSPCGSRLPQQRAGQSGIVAVQPKSQNDGAWPLCGGCGKPRIPDGIGSALKPAFEPIILARKPLDGTIAANVLKHGVGGINIDACRVEGVKPLMGERTKTIVTASSMSGASTGRTSFSGETTTEGRFPANVLHDGSDEVMAAFAAFGEKTSGSVASLHKRNTAGGNGNTHGHMTGVTGPVRAGDSGSSARFFYSAKASAADRAGSKHPTVKPLALMRWLVKLVTPPGGTVLDPFAGSGTTLQAAHECGFNAIGCEQSAEYVEDINRRLDAMTPAKPVFEPELRQAELFS